MKVFYFIKKIYLTLIPLSILFIVYLLNINDRVVTQNINQVSLLNSETVTCSFYQTTRHDYNSQSITHSLPKKETNPIINTFSKLSDKNPTMSYIDATRSITTVNVYKVFEDNEKLMLIDKQSDAYISVYTLFKSEGVATYMKSISIFGMPSTISSMGQCLPY